MCGSNRAEIPIYEGRLREYRNITGRNLRKLFLHRRYTEIGESGSEPSRSVRRFAHQQGGAVTTTPPSEDRLPDAERVRNGTRLQGEYAVNRVADALQLPPGVREDAGAFLHGALEAGACPDYAPETVGTAAAYAAIRRSERPWTRTEVVDAADGDNSAVTGAYHSIVRTFGLCLNPPDPEQFVGRIVDECDLPNAVERRARDRLETTETHDSDSALGLAAAAVIVESDASPADVAELTPLSALSVRSRYLPRFDER